MWIGLRGGMRECWKVRGKAAITQQRNTAALSGERIMKARNTVIALAAVVPLLLGSSCPTPVEQEPPHLKSPRFLESRVLVAKVGGLFEELVYLSWAPPDSDSAAVDAYVMMQRLPFDTAIDTLGIFPSQPERIPAPRTWAYEPTQNIRKYGSGEVMMLYYRVFAIDTLGNAGDTSVQCSVALLKNADAVYPKDSLLDNRFEWEIAYVQDEVFTNIMVWNSTDTAAIFVSDTINDFANFWVPTECSAALPDRMYPLPGGMYTWAIWAQKPMPPPGAVSYTIGTFRVP